MLQPLTRIQIRGDGTTVPSIAPGTVLLIVQSGKIFTVGRWLPTEEGGEITPPVNEDEMLLAAVERLAAEDPGLLKSQDAMQLTCWPDLIAEMRFDG